MEKIFISYRRIDSSHATDRIYTKLCKHLCKRNIFKDIESIDVGVDFRERLYGAIDSSTVMLVIIGNNWLSIKDRNKEIRLFNDDDFVRVEIERAIKKNILIIPVLIEESDLPSPENLPESIRELSYRNAIKVRPSPDFNNDINNLINEIKKHISIKNRINIKLLYIYSSLLIFILCFSVFVIHIFNEVKLEDIHDEFSKIRSDYDVNEKDIVVKYRYENIKNNLPSIIYDINSINDIWLSNDNKIEKYDILLFSYFIMSATYAREYIETNNESFKYDSLNNIKHSILSKDKLFKYLKGKKKDTKYMNGVYLIVANTYAVSEFLGVEGSFTNTEKYLKKIDSIYKQQINIYNEYFLNKHRKRKKHARTKKS